MTPSSKFTILDCSVLLPGPSIGRLMANHGHRVYKIENPAQPDGAKAIGQSFYQYLNSKKTIVPIDLKSDEGQKEFHNHLLNADAVIEAFLPETKKKLGLDFESIHKVNPKTVVLSLVGYPENSPMARRAGHDLNFQALTGSIDRQRSMPRIPYADMLTVYRGAFELMRALSEARINQVGSKVSVSFFETMRETQEVFALEWASNRNDSQTSSSKLFSGEYPCYRVYSCLDRKISVGAIEFKYWKSFCDALELPNLHQKQYAVGETALETINRIEDKLKEKPWKEWEDAFSRANCCVEPVLTYAEVYGK